MDPRFSVVLPVRNRADSVGRAAVAVLAQTFSDVELLVVDGGSSDGTVDAVRTVADDRVRIIAEDTPGHLRRSGLAACRGDWVTVIDPDTTARPQWLARCGLLADRSGADVVLCGGSHHHPDGSRSEVLPAPQASRPGAILARVEATRDPRPIATPELLLDWFEGSEPSQDDLQAGPEDDLRRLQWALDAIDTLCGSPIPEVDLLARYATIGGVAAARLRRHREAQRLLAMARRVRCGEIRPLARWLVASVPPLSDRVWAPLPH